MRPTYLLLLALLPSMAGAQLNSGPLNQRPLNQHPLAQRPLGGGIIQSAPPGSAPLLGPIRENAYGPGVNSDATGRAFQWRTSNGTPALGAVNPNAYGPGVGSDSTGWPVQAWPSDPSDLDPTDPN